MYWFLPSSYPRLHGAADGGGGRSSEVHGWVGSESGAHPDGAAAALQPHSGRLGRVELRGSLRDSELDGTADHLVSV